MPIGFGGCGSALTRISIKSDNDSWRNRDGYNIMSGESLKLKCETFGTVGSISWKSDNISAAIVDQKGLVTGVRGGTTTISAYTAEGLHDEVKVIVKEEQVKSVTIKNAQDIEPGQSISLEAEVKPEKGTYKLILWSSSDPETISVDNNGVVTGLKVGSATITATSINGVKGEAVISSLGEEVSFAVYPSYSINENNSIGWDFRLGTIAIDKQEVAYGGTFTTRVGKQITCSFSVVEEDADYDDEGYFVQSTIVPNVAVGSGFNLNGTIFITENSGRYSGNSAKASGQMNFVRMR